MNHAIKNKPPRFFASRWQAVLVMFLLAFGMNGQANAGLNDGLVAYWSFDDCTAKDNSGNGHDGVIQNNAQCTEGKNGKALSFNGSSQFVEVQDPNRDFAMTNLSISVWINPSDSQMDYAAIIDKSHTSASDAISGWVLQKSPIGDGLPFYFAYCTNTPYCSSWDTGDGSQRVTVNTSNWNHLVITKQGGDVAYYLNNQFVSKQTYSFSEYTKTSLPLLIGAVNQQGGSNARYFNGLIDELRIYNRALTDAEVTALYQQGAIPIKKGVYSSTDYCLNHNDWCAHPTFEVLGTVSQSDIPINLINASYIVDELTRTNDNSRATFTANLYNRGYADAMLDIYDRQGNWTGFIPLDGNRPETTIVGDIWDHWTTIYDSLNDDYSTLDPRDAAGVAELAVRFSIPRGGYAKLSKNSTSALANTLLNNALEVFGEREWIKQQGKTNKMKLLKIFINEAINEGIDELIGLLQDAFNRNDVAEAETIKQQILTKAFSISYSVFVNNTDVVARAIGNNKAKRFAKKAIKFFAPLSTAIKAVETDALILSITGQWVDIARASDPRNDKTVYFK